jgi:hypothetical protein
MIFNQNLKFFFLGDDCHFGYFTKLAPKKKTTCFKKRGDKSRWNVAFGFLKNEGNEFYFTLYLFLGLLFFVGSFFNVMVVGPTSLKGEEEGEDEGGGGGQGKGETRFTALVQSWREGVGRGTFGVAGD